MDRQQTSNMCEHNYDVTIHITTREISYFIILSVTWCSVSGQYRTCTVIINNVIIATDFSWVQDDHKSKIT